MYPSIVCLTGLWSFMIAEGYKEKLATNEIKEFVDNINLKDLQRKETWKKLIGIVKIKPDNDLLPIRTGYGEAGEKTGRIQYLTSIKLCGLP